MAKYPELTREDISEAIKTVSFYIRQHFLIDSWLNLNFPIAKKLRYKHEWDSDEENELENLFENELSIGEISRLLNRDHWNILSKLKELGLLKK